jgi:hypothetical protein
MKSSLFLWLNSAIAMLVSLLFFVALPCAAQYTQFQGQSLPYDSNGWLIVPLGAHKIYVSGSTGNDNNDGLSPATAVQTIAKGESLLNNHSDDALLLKKGDVWGGQGNDNPGTLNNLRRLSGISYDHPLVVSGYGSGPRPLLKTDAGGGLGITGGGGWVPGNTVDNIVIDGIEFYDNESDPNSPDFIGMAKISSVNSTGICDLLPGSNWVIQDCKLSFYTNAVVLEQDGTQGHLNNVQLIRNVIVDDYSAGLGHSQGVFLDSIHDLLLRENVLDNNGYNQAVSSINSSIGEPTIFNHDAYIQYTNTNVSVIGNIFSRPSSVGCQMRPGGTMLDNLFVYCPIAGFSGSGSENNASSQNNLMQYNVVLESTDEGYSSSYLPRGDGLELNYEGTFVPGNITCDSNIIANKASGTRGGDPGLKVGYGSAPAPSVGQAFNGTITNNIVYNWNNSAYLSIGIPALQSLTVTNNYLQNPLGTGGNLVEISTTPFSLLHSSFANDHYYSVPIQSSWFNLVTKGQSNSTWTTISGETGATFQRVAFPDPGRTIESYDASLGGSGTFNDFIVNCRQQSKDNWNSALTAYAVNAYIQTGFYGQPLPATLAALRGAGSGHNLSGGAGSGGGGNAGTGNGGGNNSGNPHGGALNREHLHNWRPISGHPHSLHLKEPHLHNQQLHSAHSQEGKDLHKETDLSKWQR